MCLLRDMTLILRLKCRSNWAAAWGARAFQPPANGVGGGALFLGWQSFTMGNEGMTLAIRPDATVILSSLTAGVLLGLFASFWPAWQAARQPIIASLRN